MSFTYFCALLLLARLRTVIICFCAANRRRRSYVSAQCAPGRARRHRRRSSGRKEGHGDGASLSLSRGRPLKLEMASFAKGRQGGRRHDLLSTHFLSAPERRSINVAYLPNNWAPVRCAPRKVSNSVGTREEKGEEERFIFVETASVFKTVLRLQLDT